MPCAHWFPFTGITCDDRQPGVDAETDYLPPGRRDVFVVNERELFLLAFTARDLLLHFDSAVS